MQKPPNPAQNEKYIDSVVHQTLKDCLAQHGGQGAEMCMAIEVSLKWLAEKGFGCRKFQVQIADGGLGFKCLESGDSGDLEGLWKALVVGGSSRVGPTGHPILSPQSMVWDAGTQRLTVDYARVRHEEKTDA
jgi:hypothetical protein